jgi:hypothetical protein
LREALLNSSRIRPLTAINGRPTPILIRGAQRRCSVDTAPVPGKRPNGLYGNAFHRASTTAIREATTLITPPTLTNILAIEAPPGGRGTYRMDEIGGILRTAYSAFAAARVDSYDAIRHQQPYGTAPVTVAPITTTPSINKSIGGNENDDGEEEEDDGGLSFTTDETGRLVVNIKGSASHISVPTVAPSTATIASPSTAVTTGVSIRELPSTEAHVEIHTGNWGTGDSFLCDTKQLTVLLR